MRRNSDSWVTGCDYFESVTFVRNVIILHCGVLDETMMNLYLYNKIFYLKD